MIIIMVIMIMINVILNNDEIIIGMSRRRHRRHAKCSGTSERRGEASGSSVTNPLALQLSKTTVLDDSSKHEQT